MTPLLTDERKADIQTYLRENPISADRAFLKGVLIDPETSDTAFLTDEMIDGLLLVVEPPKAEPEDKRSHYKRAIRVRRAAETWRHLDNYPGYQISSHGRLRTHQRANADDVLKPRFSWHHGKLVTWYELRDKDGNRKSRFTGPLMMQAGFVKPWRKKPAGEPPAEMAVQP